MKTDCLNRRLRHSEPQPLDKLIGLRERDFLIFEVLHRHGPLPSNYLYEFTKHVGRDSTALKHRLTQLYNGTKDGTKYLTRPPQQFASFMARYQFMIHDLAPAARQSLAETGRLSPHIRPRNDHFLHRLMTASVTGSLELAISRADHRYITRDQIIARDSCPASTRASANPLALTVVDVVGVKEIVPDELFGINYGGAYRFVALEADRNTEAIERSNLSQTAFGRKLRAYAEVIKTRAYKERWGVPNLLILTVTSSRTHLDYMLRFVNQQVAPVHRDRFMFRAKPEFGANWRVPEVMIDLYQEPWLRADGNRFSLNIP